MNALVTGGAGFIGSHLVDRLIADGHHVTVVDNFSTGRRQNLQAHGAEPRLSCIEADIVDPVAVGAAMRNIDWVFHLAALADIVPSVQRPLDYFRANVQGTATVVEAARHSGVRRFVYAASSSCYGIPDEFPTPETAEIRPQYPYALTKALGEELVLHWALVYRLSAMALRLFNVYGPRSRTSGTYGAVFGVFLAQKLAGRPFTVVGDGTQTRDFTFVTDVVDAFVTAATSDLAGIAINVGSGKPHSINRLVELLGGDVEYIPKRPGEPDCTHADTTQIQRLLHWQAKVPFDAGVRIMLEHISDWQEAPVWTSQSIAVATREWFDHLHTHAST